MMARNASSLDLYRTGMTFVSLMAQTQMVMTYRMMGMAGVWKVAGSENRRMVDEKGPAFAESMIAGARALMTGQRPDQVAMAAMQPLHSKTSSNSRRLARRGPKLPVLK